MTERLRIALVALAALLACAGLPAASGAEGEAPCAHRDPLRRPFFGDLHVHTTHSLDASTQGTRTTPEQAYRFARGAEVGLHPFDAQGQPLRRARLTRPLDFAAITDHGELFGETAICRTPGLPGHESFACRVYRGWPRLAFFLMNGRGHPRFRFCGEDGAGCLEAARGPWQDLQSAAEVAYDRSSACRFTSFVATEWTGGGPGAANLHRNVVFRSARVPALPPNSIDQPSKEALWDALDVQCRSEDGCEAVVIPHNSNLSGGLMFQALDAQGAPLSAAEARRRSAREPLVEIMQHKGSSECRRSTAPSDELCGFEELPYATFLGRFLPFLREDGPPRNFVRHTLAQGLVEQQRSGANPFKLGILASTDTHLGTPGLADESVTLGHGGAGVFLGDTVPDALLDPIEYNPGGLAVVWAEENRRDALFSALRRRETYGTSGPRLVLRFFGGWGYPESLCEDPDFVLEGYRSGVPMGGDLPPRSADPTRRATAPTLAVSALRDPAGEAPLQRLQIVKAWVQDGEPREAVYDVAGNPDNGASVDLTSCEPQGVGFDRLCRVWRDPDFDPQAPALYYARAVENPTCRWSTRACNAAGIDCSDPSSLRPGWEACCDAAYPRTVQERAWSSPIWYEGWAQGTHQER